MKSILLFSISLLTIGSYAQSFYTSTVMDNSDSKTIQLLTMPWDQSQLGQVKNIYDQSSNTTDYVLEEISTGVNNPITIPLCSAMRGKPTVLEDGILFTGESSTDGKECMFFDGVNTTVYDLNIGAGSSNPKFYLLQDRVFLIANGGDGNQLYEFDQIAHTVTKLTFGSASVSRVCAVWNDAVYYSTRSFNSADSEYEFTLIKAQLGSVPSYSSLRTISVPSGSPFQFVAWDFPQIKWGKLYMTEDVYSLFSPAASDLSIISIDQSNVVTTVHEDLQSDGKISQLFEWNDALWTYARIGSASQLYKSADGISFVADANSGMKSLTDYHLSENNKLYFILEDGATASDELAVYDVNGALQTLYTGEELDFLLEENNTLYLSNEQSTVSSSILLAHTNYDIIEEVSVAQGEYLPMPNVSTYFDNHLTFLFRYNPTDVDVLKLTGSPQAGLTALTNNLQIYPNPVESGNALFLNSEIEGNYQMYTSDQRTIADGVLQKGLNQLDIAELSTGLYFLSFQGVIHQVLIK